MRGFEQIHSEIFPRGSRITRPPLTQGSPIPDISFDENGEDLIPGLCDLSKSSEYPYQTQERSRRHGNIQAKTASAEQLSAFDHHCRYAFMRSSLSRIEAQNLNMNATNSDPCISEIIEAGKDMSEDELIRFLNVLKLKILNR